jgi:hypothetical protein
MMDVSGRCHCGLITFRAAIDLRRVTICHCTDCRHLTGSAYRDTTSGGRQDFQLPSGEPTTDIKCGERGAESCRHFCPRWCSHLYRTADDADVIGIRLGGIDQRGAAADTEKPGAGRRFPGPAPSANCRSAAKTKRRATISTCLAPQTP